ncbi:Hypothetical predicted protein [Mytilus galloprovincialis]|uniref:Chitin-binding type-2 domain-containing protein n=1 Tax=Mytilus galloprovincialis TaxID=29158 RepID=A0A8B6C7S0_MYTGA|nr:Hypothetical predicted protein [Mytilus galloprovincialis]
MTVITFFIKPATPQFATECITRCDPNAIRCYVPHPTNCKYYLDCIRKAGATQFVQYSIQECGLHYFFNPDTSKCDHLDEFICKQDPCVINKWTNGTTYPVPNSCNLYYKCQHTEDGMMIHTRQACQCENKLKYDTTISGTDDHDHCIKDTTNACSIVDNSRTTPKLERCKRFKIGDNKYIEDGSEKECATGQIFKSERCSCVWGELPTTPTVTTTVQPTSNGECIPSIHLDFSTILSTDPQLQGQDNVQVANGKGYFGGLSFIANPQLNNNILPIFIAKLKLKMDTSFSFGSNSLLKSCSGNPMASIQMYAERTNTKNKLITKVMISDFRAITVSNDKYDIYDNKEVTITLGFNREMVAVEVALSAAETDLQQVAFSNAPKDFLACNGALNVGQPFGGNGPFVGDIYDWKVWNGCDNIPVSMEYLFN